MENKRKYLKTMPVLAVALLLLAGTGFAALLTNYGQITGTVEVSQSVLVDGESYDDSMRLSDDGGIHTLENTADVPATVSIDTICEFEGSGDCTGVTTRYYKVGTLELSGKSDCHADGTCVPTETKATVNYTIVGERLYYTIESEDITDLEAYTLVYYPNRDYSVYTGEIIPISEEVGSLPVSGDLNGGEESTYCSEPANSEGVNCQGAKIWLVPTVDIDFNNEGFVKLDGWKGDHYLYETDLITYTQEEWDVSSLTLQPDEMVLFLIRNYEDVALMSGIYTITTLINPAP